ncbi:hypothetical protein HDE_00189 [Halotydeus destructor]|nr:hypothetical protein HDE_00189 [Halotydeus destructor]
MRHAGHVGQETWYVSPIKAMLAMAGLGFDYRSWYARSLNHAMFLVHSFNLVVQLVSSLGAMYERFSYGFLFTASSVLVNVHYMTVIKCNSSLLRKSLSVSDTLLSSSQKRKVRRMGLIANLIITADLLMRVAGLFYSFNELSYFFSLSQAVKSTALQSFSGLFSHIILTTHTLFCLIYGEIMIAILQRIPRADVPVTQIEILMNTLKSLVGSFNDKLSIIAFTWLAQTFAFSLAFTVDVLNIDSSKILSIQVVYSYSLLFDILFIFTVCTLIGNVHPNLQAEFRRQLGAILESEGLSSRAAYVSSREYQFQLRFTAWGVFDLNKNCMLTYLSALVTFTILFMQLNKVL